MSNFYEQDFEELFEENEVDTEAFIEKIKEYVPLFEKIAEQMGYSDIYNDKDDLICVLQEMNNIYHHGCSVGIGGFIYYSETEKFFDENSSEIIDSHKDMADNLGESFDEMVSNFQNGGDYILDLLEGGNRLKNDLVWGYLENKVSYLFDSDFEEFKDCFSEKKYELTPEQEEEGFRIEDGYLYDKDNNYWELNGITIEEAIEYSKILENCTNCENCKDCKHCVECASCEDCKDCTKCVRCIQCENCKNCVWCHHCTGCESCNSCINCHNCQDCTECKDCNNLNDCHYENGESNERDNTRRM